MKLTVKRDHFLKALQKVINIIGSRSTLPVLANVLMEADGNELSLTTTDLEIRISTKVEANIEKGGKTTVPAKKLYALVSRFIGDDVSLNCDEKHHTEIVCGTSKFKLLGLGADDFPLPVEFASHKNIKFKETDFRKMLDQISYAVSLDDTRKVLHGILVSIKDSAITAVATDGKRLALVEKVPEEFEGEEGDTIVPLKAATEVKRMIDGDGFISLEFGEKQACFKTDKVTLTTKLIEGNFPNYRQVIPARFNKVIEVPTSPMLAKLELVSLALADNSSYIVVTLEDNKIQMQAASNNVGEGVDYMDVEYADARMDISFNPTFLADPLKHCDADKVKIKLNDGFSPVAIEGGEGFLYVIMPMRNR
ncbi:MAG: DNA polymerase III subunit beta [Lentisphaerae bacterium]|nr:DNA polymerase III subunit beta [Lentisphaerota bacterium]MCP4100418.1 DNA polymerase III subunit beta [Lentisphaerota bacterium]